MELNSIVLALGIPGVAIVCWAVIQVSEQWRKARQAEWEAALKQEMIQRGMSADDIIRVLQGKHGDKNKAGSAGTDTGKEDLGEQMVENEYSGEDIVKVIQACHAKQGLDPGVRATVRGMVENGYEADDIVKVIEGSKVGPGTQSPPTLAPPQRPSTATTEFRAGPS